MVVKVTYADFVGDMCDALSREQLIVKIAQSLNEGDYIEFEDGRRCYNETELRVAIEERR